MSKQLLGVSVPALGSPLSAGFSHAAFRLGKAGVTAANSDLPRSYVPRPNDTTTFNPQPTPPKGHFNGRMLRH